MRKTSIVGEERGLSAHSEIPSNPQYTTTDYCAALFKQQSLDFVLLGIHTHFSIRNTTQFSIRS